MTEDTAFWDFYWSVRLESMETLGKREAILAGSRLVRRLAAQNGSRARMLELGCGEGQIIGALARAHEAERGTGDSVGVDYLPASLAVCRRNYPKLRFIQGDFTDPALLESLGTFDLLLLVNALHEVFSAAYTEELGEVDVDEGKRRVRQALARAAERLAPGGLVLLFDGLEPPGSPDDPLRVRFLHPQAREHFHAFTREYRPFIIRPRETADPMVVELTRRDFTRYIDKSIFLGKRLWQTERLESYQYFTETEFREAFEEAGLEIEELRTLTVNEEKWRDTVEIETPGENFQAEHVLIVGRRK